MKNAPATTAATTPRTIFSATIFRTGCAPDRVWPSSSTNDMGPDSFLKPQLSHRRCSNFDQRTPQCCVGSGTVLIDVSPDHPIDRGLVCVGRIPSRLSLLNE